MLQLILFCLCIQVGDLFVYKISQLQLTTETVAPADPVVTKYACTFIPQAFKFMKQKISSIADHLATVNKDEDDTTPLISEYEKIGLSNIARNKRKLEEIFAKSDTNSTLILKGRKTE